MYALINQYPDEKKKHCKIPTGDNFDMPPMIDTKYIPIVKNKQLKRNPKNPFLRALMPNHPEISINTSTDMIEIDWRTVLVIALSGADS